MEIEEAISAALLAEGAGVWALWRAVSGRNGYLGDPDMLALVREAQAKRAAAAGNQAIQAVQSGMVDEDSARAKYFEDVDAPLATPSPGRMPKSGAKVYVQTRTRPRWGTRSKAARPARPPPVVAALRAARPGD